MLRQRNGMTQKNSLVSLGEQPNNRQGGQGGWRHWMQPGKDHTQEGQSSDMGLSLSRGASGGGTASALLSDGQAGVWVSATNQSPPNLFMNIENPPSRSQGCMRGEVGSNTAAHHTAQIRAPWGEGNLPSEQRDCHPPCGGTSHKVRQHCWSCRLVPWSFRDDSTSVFISITSFAGSGQGEEGSHVLTESFQPALLPPGAKRCPGAFPALGLWAGLPQQCHHIAQVPSLQSLPSTLVHPHQDISCLLWSPLQLGISIPWFSN